MFYKAKSTPEEWEEGSVSANVTDIEFSEVEDAKPTTYSESLTSDKTGTSKQFETQVYKVFPFHKKVISSISIGGKDRHLIISGNKEMLYLPKKKIASIGQEINDLWVNSKYVLKEGYGNWTEIKTPSMLMAIIKNEQDR